MKKKLPGIYKGTVQGVNINQKQAVFNSSDEPVENVLVNEKQLDIPEKNINGKINDIFNSPNYVYRANVSIVLQNGETLKKTIIGRTNNSLITIDDELIEVNGISQIDFLD